MDLREHKSLIAIAMPIYNEADGIAETLQSIDEAFHESKALITICIQNDVSTDDTLKVISEVSPSLHLSIAVETNENNSGHGPTVTTAYRRAIATGASTIMQLDSDGQFVASELPNLCTSIAEGRQVVIGIRSNRIDPWFRKSIACLLRNFLRIRYLGKFPDPNSPVRAYSNAALSPMLDHLPTNPLIPNIFLAILANRRKLDTAYIPISHRERRGNESTGTMWQSTNQWKKLLRLLKFCQKAFFQLLTF